MNRFFIQDHISLVHVVCRGDSYHLCDDCRIRFLCLTGGTIETDTYYRTAKANALGLYDAVLKIMAFGKSDVGDVIVGRSELGGVEHIIRRWKEESGCGV